MSITKDEKKQLIEEYALKKDDTGSPEVQCALLTKQIKELTEHSKSNPKDHQSRRGLLVKVNQRKRLLNYLKNKDHDRYKSLIGRLGLRK